MVLDLIQNIALLVTLAVGLQMLAWRVGKRPALYRLATGILFGAVGIIGMMTPMHFAPGVIYDGRSIVLSLAGLFGGPVVAAVAAAMCGAYRMHLGGAGATAGVSTVIEAAAIGTVLYYLRRRDEAWVGPVRLWVFALIVHIVMMALQLLIPTIGWDVLRRVGPSVLFFYPIAFLLIAQVFLDGERRRKAEAALRESEERFRLCMEATSDGLWDWNIPTDKGYFSPGYYRMLGYEVGAFPAEGSEWTKLIHPDDRENALRANLDCIEGRSEFVQIEYRMKAVDGQWRWILGRGKCIARDGQGRALRMVGMHIDITERKRAEGERLMLEEQLRQSQKMETVGRFAGGVAHDFNNLLQAILGYAELVRGHLEPDSEDKSTLDEVCGAARRAADLTRQLLAFSRRQVIQPVNVNLNELLQGVLKMIRRVIGENIELHFKPGGNLGTVRVDRGQIEQVLINLCVNARDAMPKGGTLIIETKNVTLDAAFCRENLWALEGRYAVLSVTDTGHGMDEETCAHIFEPFFTTKDVGHGTGLGLATVYGIARQHNSLIRVDSAPGKGAVFTIYVPIVEHSPEEVTARIEKGAVGGSETILVAEDAEMVRRLIVRLLEGAGYTVFAAHDGKDALRVFDEHADKIDMAILDVMMPGIGGRDVMERIQAKCPRMRFLFSSGYSENAIHTDFVIKDGLRLITKPYSKTDLLHAVRETLDAPSTL